MSTNIRYPDISSESTSGQLGQIKSYLHQLVGELNYALENGSSGTNTYVVNKNGVPIAADEKGEAVDPVARFNEIKALIIKSADIVEAYYEKMAEKFQSVYLAKSDYGTYFEEAAHDIVKTSKDTTEYFEQYQQITDATLDDLDFSVAEIKGYIKTGEVDQDENGLPILGIEIRQATETDGDGNYKAMVRFTPGKLSFFDASENEVAYISNHKLYITNAEITGNLKLGEFVIDTSKGFTLKYEGR